MASLTTISDLTSEFTRLQRQKARTIGGVEARVLQAICFDAGEHGVFHANGKLFARSEPNTVNLNFNLIVRWRQQFIGRLYAVAGSYRATPDTTDPKAKAHAEVVDKLIIALDHKLKQPLRSWELFDWMTLGGVAFEYTPWVPDAVMEPMPERDPTTGELLFVDTKAGVTVPHSLMMQAVQMGAPQEQFKIKETVRQVGDVGSFIYGPLNVLLDAGVRSVEDLGPDQSVSIATVRTIGWIRDTYGEDIAKQIQPQRDIRILQTDLQQVSNALAGTNIKDLLPVVQGSVDESDPDICVFVERFQPQSKAYPHGRFTCFVPEQVICADDGNKYEEIPIVDYHLFPTTGNFWTQDFVTPLIPVQKYINKRYSQMAMFANANANQKRLLGAGIKASDVTADDNSPIENAISDNGFPLVQREAVAQLPGWFQKSIQDGVAIGTELARGRNPNQSRVPGQMRGSLVVPFMQELDDAELTPLLLHIGEQMAKVKQQRINRVKQFYPAIRTLHYTNANQRDEVLEFHNSEILKSGTEYHVTVERSSLTPELRAMREARIKERLSSPLGIIYVDERTGRIDKSKLAEDLQFGDTGRESREAQYRKFAQEMVSRLKVGQPVPPPLPFFDVAPMLDEVEAAMVTTEFLGMSVELQQAFMGYWKALTAIGQQQASMQQQAMQSQMMQGAVAQATQQTAAQVASETVQASMGQIQAQIATVDPEALVEAVVDKLASQGQLGRVQ